MKVKSDFCYRHTRYEEYQPDQYKIEEHFWLNRESEDRAPGNMLYCLAYGECVWQKGCTVHEKRRRSHRWTFEYIVEGSVDVCFEGGTFRLKEGDILICGPDRRMSRSVERHGFLRKRVVILTGGMVDYLCTLHNLSTLRYVTVDDRERFGAIYDAIHEAVTGGSFYLAGDLNSLAYSLLAELSRIGESSKYPRHLSSAVRFIERQLQVRLTLRDVSAECGVSIKTLNRLFNEYLNVSPVNYIIARRLEQARHLIALDGLSLKEIAFQCGYSSESFFSRAFKQKYGLSPNAYRQSASPESSLRPLESRGK